MCFALLPSLHLGIKTGDLGSVSFTFVHIGIDTCVFMCLFISALYVMINVLQDSNDWWLSNYSLTEEPDEHSAPAVNTVKWSQAGSVLASGLEVEGEKMMVWI